jgi:hypothetical protein
MPQPPKKRTGSRPSRLPVRPVGEPEVVRFTTRTEPGEVETEPLFYIDDVEYRVPVHLPSTLALKYLRRIRKEGQDLAADWLLEQVLTPEGYDALVEHDFETTASSTSCSP